MQFREYPPIAENAFGRFLLMRREQGHGFMRSHLSIPFFIGYEKVHENDWQVGSAFRNDPFSCHGIAQRRSRNP